MRRILCSLLAAIAMMVVYLPAAGASAHWCEDDPPLQLTTLSGRQVTVHVTNSGELTSNAATNIAIRKAVHAATVQAVPPTGTLSADGTATIFTVQVDVSATSGTGVFNIMSRAGTRPGLSDVMVNDANPSLTVFDGQLRAAGAAGTSLTYQIAVAN